MPSEIEVQLHLWPWSAGCPERYGIDTNGETVDFKQGKVSFPYYGSPVISVSSSADIYLPKRYEHFVEFGPKYQAGQEAYQLYELPHGVLFSNKSDQNIGYLWIKGQEKRYTVYLEKIDSLSLNSTDAKASHGQELKSALLEWSQQFDILFEKFSTRDHHEWSLVLDHFFSGVDRPDEPRMALIVEIAEKMSKKISGIVHSARKILIRERTLMPVSKISELDNRCILWISRQKGDTLAQKAAQNSQRLLSISRRESFDTLENRVLKSFLYRCFSSASHYLDTEVNYNPVYKKSDRGKSVRMFRNICTSLHSIPHLQEVTHLQSLVRPNYVLQNDFRYREVWEYYLRLLKSEDEKDKMWDWQGRAWADISRVIVCLTFYKLSADSHQSNSDLFHIQELFTSQPRILKEQKLGCRLNAGCEPGPFIIYSQKNNIPVSWVLEMVHSDHASSHPVVQKLGQLGGHIYLVFSSLSDNKKVVVPVWGIHTAAALEHPAWEEISNSAENALHRQLIMQSRMENPPKLRGVVLASDLEIKECQVYESRRKEVHLVRLPADSRKWSDALIWLEVAFEDTLKDII
ncbi:DUF2357 domain-containing protein [Desulfonatronovibrio magnus]|uniref:DUF2357 domain-containing protein n=1 Tax=Desulfonatronovibrio magnus TaxID=698827 RepID=UPI0005EACACB|nr:DUF2357 domain-containing protein [Desulfonatronovibrio magnus]